MKRPVIVICLSAFLIARGALAAHTAANETAAATGQPGQKYSGQPDKPAHGTTETQLPSGRPPMASIDDQVRALAADLGLGEDQRARLTTILQAQQEQVQAAIYDRSLSQEDRLNRFRGLNDALVLKIRDLLNDDQRKKFDQKTGKRGHAQAQDDGSSHTANTLEPADVPVPTLVANLRPSIHKFHVKFNNGDQQSVMDQSTTIREDKSSWIVTDLVDMPNGRVTDISTLEKGSLILRKRSLTQGSVAVNLDFSNENASGSLNFSGVQQPISADIGGPLFADSAGWEEVIGCLPLAVNYTTSFRNFDLQAHRAKLIRLKVADVEKVIVPAGTFDSFRVELTSADGGPERSIVWISRISREPVKVFAVLGSTGRATMSAELLP